MERPDSTPDGDEGEVAPPGRPIMQGVGEVHDEGLTAKHLESLTALPRLAADRALGLGDEDLLDRGPYAVHISRALRNWDGHESLVVAVYGDWGSGKSSLKGMVLHALKAEGNAPDIVELTPWSWTDPQAWVQAFFRELGLAVGHDVERAEKHKEAAALLRAYAARVTGSETTHTGLKALSALAAAPAATALVGTLGLSGIAGVIASWLPSALARAAASAVALLFLVVGVGLAFAVQRFKARAEREEAEGKAAELPLHRHKERIRALLAARERPILVVVDEVDRLTPPEVRTLFQLVKANADFPNVTYLLFFQRDVVEASLDVPDVIAGRDYLKKIVQVGLDLPEPPPGRLRDVLHQEVVHAVRSVGLMERFDEARWNEFVIHAAGHYFRNLRDIRRFAASYGFYLGGFLDRGGAEVDPVDLFGLETLRMFEPDSYGLLSGSKDALTKEDLFRPSSKSWRRPALDDIIEAAGDGEAMGEALQMLFPVTAGELTSDASTYRAFSEHGAMWARGRRVCHPDYFDGYFRFKTPEVERVQDRVERMLERLSDPDALASMLQGFIHRGEVEEALDRLRAFDERIAASNPIPFLIALFDVGDALPHVGKNLVSPPTLALHLIVRILLALQRLNGRLTPDEVLVEAARASGGLDLVVSLADTFEEAGEDGPGRFGVTPRGALQLRDAALHSLRTAANGGTLIEHHRLLDLLLRWKAWAPQPGEVWEWTGRLAEGVDGLARLVRAFAKHDEREGSHLEASGRIDLAALFDVLPEERLNEGLKRLGREEIASPRHTPEDAGVVRKLLDLLSARRAAAMTEEVRQHFTSRMGTAPPPPKPTNAGAEAEGEDGEQPSGRDVPTP